MAGWGIQISMCKVMGANGTLSVIQQDEKVARHAVGMGSIADKYLCGGVRRHPGAYKKSEPQAMKNSVEERDLRGHASTFNCTEVPDRGCKNQEEITRWQHAEVKRSKSLEPGRHWPVGWNECIQAAAQLRTYKATNVASGVHCIQIRECLNAVGQRRMRQCGDDIMCIHSRNSRWLGVQFFGGVARIGKTLLSRHRSSDIVYIPPTEQEFTITTIAGSPVEPVAPQMSGLLTVAGSCLVLPYATTLGLTAVVIDDMWSQSFTACHLERPADRSVRCKPIQAGTGWMIASGTGSKTVYEFRTAVPLQKAWQSPRQAEVCALRRGIGGDTQASLFRLGRRVKRGMSGPSQRGENMGSQAGQEGQKSERSGLALS
ncbi:uncharacterized protein EI90DRAFT_3015958 [Cantharellus anzutake]|uniref:uncharacterized protein n=1 Tax=Cantharellus anzutake TaxID=1750568 RepID=UPI00190328D8|nr:uncharacterized protein EI90DRAFT_3015958 [Cantharellus anzutake]KAF8332371.1 hypothetical protein EI90DRAFT_3015958 [Cantharellus anzutake]